MSTRIKIAIAEQSAILRFGLEKILKNISGFNIQIIEIKSPEVLLTTLQTQQPNILIINPAWLSFQSIQTIHQESNCPKLKLAALFYNTIPNELPQLYDTQLHLYETPDEIWEKIKRLSLPLFKKSITDHHKKQELTTREKEVIICAVKGMTNKEIADKLYLSTHTIITHRRNIARKLQIHSVSGLTIYAIVNKLVELSDIQQ